MDLLVIELLSAAGAVIFGILSWHYNVSYQLSIGLGIAMLVTASLTFAIGREDLANFISLLAYLLMVVGLSLALLDYRRRSVEIDRKT